MLESVEIENLNIRRISETPTTTTVHFKIITYIS